jgi:ABC-type amino acid transport substrate-binding protein
VKVFPLVWLLAGYFVFAYFTASVTTTFTLAEIDHRISSPADLFDQRVGVVQDSAAQDYLNNLGIPTQAGPTIEERIQQLEDRKLDAVVHHAPYLQYYASHAGNGNVRVSGVPFSELEFGIALPEGSRYREPLNRALLRLIEDGTYQRIHDRWF